MNTISQLCSQFQPPVHVYPGKQQVMALAVASLAPTGDTWTKVLTHSNWVSEPVMGCSPCFSSQKRQASILL